jgi:hypothetical protein
MPKPASTVNYEYLLGYGVVMTEQALREYYQRHYVNRGKDLRQEGDENMNEISLLQRRLTEKFGANFVILRIRDSTRYFVTSEYIKVEEGAIWTYAPDIRDFMVLAKLANNVPLEGLHDLPKKDTEAHLKVILALQEYEESYNYPKVQVVQILKSETA